MKPNIRLLLILLSSATFLLSCFKLLEVFRDYRLGVNRYESLGQYVSFETVQPTEPTESTEATESINSTSPPAMTDPLPEPTLPPVFPQVDFEALSEINPDVVGWIYLDGTNINYPVVQGEDNDYYLKHLFDGTQNRAGCIFLDYRCSPDLSDRNSIVYGHHLRNGTMFTALMKYKRQGFYDTYPTGLYLTPDAVYTIHFFSGYVSDNRSSAWMLNLNDDSQAAWLDAVCKKSCFRPNTLPNFDDPILTLSTCTYEFDDAKFVLHGYLVPLD